MEALRRHISVFSFVVAVWLLTPLRITAGAAGGAAAGDDGGLSKQEFDKLLGREGMFGMFFAPWCGHCKSLMPDWVKLMKHFENEDRITVFMVNGDTQTELVTDFEIEGYPTLLYFAKGYRRSSGKPEVYNGPRTIDFLVDFVNSKAGTRRRADGTLIGQVSEVDDVIGTVECSAGVPVWECAGKMHEAMEENKLQWKFPVEGEWTQKFINYYNQFLKGVHERKQDIGALKTEMKRLQLVVAKYQTDVQRTTFDFFQGRIEVLGHIIQLFDPSFVPPKPQFMQEVAEKSSARASNDEL